MLLVTYKIIVEILRNFTCNFDFVIFLLYSTVVNKSVLPFLTLYNKVENNLCIWFVCFPVSARFNFHEYYTKSCILCMLFISHVAWIILKMVHIELIIRLQRYTNFCDTFRPIGLVGWFFVAQSPK